MRRGGGRVKLTRLLWARRRVERGVGKRGEIMVYRWREDKGDGRRDGVGVGRTRRSSNERKRGKLVTYGRAGLGQLSNFCWGQST